MSLGTKRIIKIVLLAICDVFAVLTVGGKSRAKEGYKIRPSGLGALCHVRGAHGKDTPYLVATRTHGRNSESLCLPSIVCFHSIGQLGRACSCVQCNNELKRDTNVYSWHHCAFRLYGFQSAHLLKFNYVCPNKQCIVNTCVADRSKLVSSRPPTFRTLSLTNLVSIWM